MSCEFCIGIVLLPNERCHRCGREGSLELMKLARRSHVGVAVSSSPEVHRCPYGTKLNRTLTDYEISKLAEYGITYPWSPWSMLAAIYRWEDSK